MDTTLPLISPSEQKAVLADPIGLMALMRYHEEQGSMAECMGEPLDGKSNMLRRDALKEMGRSIIEKDLEIWPVDVLTEFGFNLKTAYATADFWRTGWSRFSRKHENNRLQVKQERIERRAVFARNRLAMLMRVFGVQCGNKAAPALPSGFVHAGDRWIDDLTEGTEIEMVVRARVTTDGHFSGPKTTHWRAVGTATS